MTTTTYTVRGMTCGHCVSSIKEEVSEVTGVSGVEVELATGRMTVTARDRLDDGAVKAAVEAAGYEVVAPS
ncbi:copper chaperone [Streptosporangium violaceochromogenes]|nr:copper chaperone [Streptosporangium violaceochromogenes]